MADKLVYIYNDYKPNYTFCNFVVKTLGHLTLWTNNWKFIKVPKVVKPTITENVKKNVFSPSHPSLPHPFNVHAYDKRKHGQIDGQPCVLIIIREGGDIGLFITLVPKVYSNVFLFNSNNKFGNFLMIFYKLVQ